MGCVIAELYFDGEPLFDLTTLLKFRNKELNPEVLLEKRIEDIEVKKLILSMIDLDPSKRLSATTYLTKFSDTLFPKYFQKLYDFLKVILSPKYNSPDSRMYYIQENQNEIFKEILGKEPPPTQQSKNFGRRRENSLYSDLPMFDERNSEYIIYIYIYIITIYLFIYLFYSFIIFLFIIIN